MFQIEECQVKIQYKSHLIEFQHHTEEVQRFFINQVKISFVEKKIKFFSFSRSHVLNLQLLVH